MQTLSHDPDRKLNLENFDAIFEVYATSNSTAQRYIQKILSTYLPSTFKALSRPFQGTFMVLSGYFQSTFKVLSRHFQGTFKTLSRHFQGTFKELSRYFQGTFKIHSSHTNYFFCNYLPATYLVILLPSMTPVHSTAIWRFLWKEIVKDLG